MENRTLRNREKVISYKETATRKPTKLSKLNTGDNKVEQQSTVPVRNDQSTSTKSRISLTKRTSIPTNSSSSSIACQSSVQPRLTATNRTSTTNSSSSTAVNRTSFSSISSKSTPVTSNSLVGEKISAIELRIKEIEDKTVQESRIIAIEAAHNQLKSENEDLQTAISKLKSDLESVQFLLVELIGLETKFNESEERNNSIITENTGLKNQILELTSELFTVKSEVKDLRSEIIVLNNQQQQSRDVLTLVEKGISIEQQELNSNIVIRGVDLVDSSCDSKPLEVYNGIRTHLGISNEADFDPVSVKVLHPKKSLGKTITNKTIQVSLRSSKIKRQFLQIRRIKKDILPNNIGLVQNSKKPILITEELTKENQELLYAARSLRETHKFKYVWSNNGQILVRPQQNSKVIRINDIKHVNELRASIQLEPLHSKNGRLCTNGTIESHPSNEGL